MGRQEYAFVFNEPYSLQSYICTFNKCTYILISGADSSNVRKHLKLPSTDILGSSKRKEIRFLIIFPSRRALTYVSEKHREVEGKRKHDGENAAPNRSSSGSSKDRKKNSRAASLGDSIPRGHSS